MPIQSLASNWEENSGENAIFDFCFLLRRGESNKGRPPQDLRWGPYAVVEREHSTILCLSGMNVLYIFCKDAI